MADHFLFFLLAINSIKPYKTIKDYNSGIPINSFKFAEMIKRLRGGMLSRRGTGMGGMGRGNGAENR
jgi:hypothetical protein